jgi:aminodeoxyfutalosine deaminase
VDYAEDAPRQVLSIGEKMPSIYTAPWRGVGWDDIFSGYCDGAQEARALHGVDVRLTPDITRGAAPEDGVELVGYAAKYRDRGVVGVGLGGEEALHPPEKFVEAFPTPARSSVRSPSGERSTRSRRTGSGTGFAPWRIRGSSRSWRPAGSSST